jgi:hypothetical protein
MLDTALHIVVLLFRENYTNLIELPCDLHVFITFSFSQCILPIFSMSLSVEIFY